LFIILEVGGVLAEYTSRIPIKSEDIEKLILEISEVTNSDEICEIINGSDLSKDNKNLLNKVAKSDNLNKNIREALATNLLEEKEGKISKSLLKTDLVAKVGSGCGLLGTLIPLGPGLSALGTGDVVSLSAQLIIAFNTTTVGLASGSIAYVISKIRRGWYEEEISAAYTLTNAILEVNYGD
ncbi:MAG: MotA/TolQ/ExbB proton channel family protein, partial [Methanobacteriaceae archaeon]|nr:MotA/TolQ/ExbB proton channel family protein [Methanobacteriaceae archaeon]